jgi:hypothetical protein
MNTYSMMMKMRIMKPLMTVSICTDIADDDRMDYDDTDDDDDEDNDDDDGEGDEGIESSTPTRQPRQRRAGISPCKYGLRNSVGEGSAEISKTPTVTLVLVPTWMSQGSTISLGSLKLEHVSRRGRAP